MKYIGMEGMSVSRIGLGIPICGTVIPVDESEIRVDMFLERGGNLIDTAHVYQDFIPDAERHASEKFLGRYIKKRGSRHDVIISTKGAYPDPAIGPDFMKYKRVNRSCIQEDIDDSLRCLQTDYIDIYWLHADDPDTPVDEIIETLEENRKAGKILCYGASNWTTDRIAAANTYSHDNGHKGFSGSQIQYSYALAHDLPDPIMVAMNEKRDTAFYTSWNKPVFCYISMANGYLSKHLRGFDFSGYLFEDMIRKGFDFDINHRRAERAWEVSEQLSCSVEAVGLAYILHRAFPTVALLQSDTQRMDQVICAADIELTDEQIRYLGLD